jgi:hypothetical protein
VGNLKLFRSETGFFRVERRRNALVKLAVPMRLRNPLLFPIPTVVGRPRRNGPKQGLKGPSILHDVVDERYGSHHAPHELQKDIFWRIFVPKRPFSPHIALDPRVQSNVEARKGLVDSHLMARHSANELARTLKIG